LAPRAVEPDLAVLEPALPDDIADIQGAAVGGQHGAALDQQGAKATLRKAIGRRGTASARPDDDDVIIHDCRILDQGLGRPNGSTAATKFRVERHAAVDIERSAGDVVGMVRRQPHYGAGDVVRLADPIVGYELQEVV